MTERPEPPKGKASMKPSKAKASNGKGIPLVVTTAHRGVFFGYGKPTTDSEIRLTEARMCVYWSAAMRGVLGLATVGPDKDCKIGFAVPVLTLRDVTSITEVSPEAVAKWEQGPWR
jgi:hypothetical protein